MINTIKLAKWIGSPLSLLLHTLLFGGIFMLRYLGIATDSLILILTTAICLEAIYLVILIQMIINKNTQNLAGVQEKVAEIQEEEKEAHKIMINILHTAHQVKTIQQELEALKKKSIPHHHKVHKA
mgnify:CR=1 FL=1